MIDLLANPFFVSQYASKDPNTAHFLFETDEDYYDYKTIKNYLRAMRQFIYYCVHIQHTTDIFPPSPELLCYYLSSRVNKSKTYGAWTSAWSGIIACLNALGFDLTYLRTAPSIIAYNKKFARIYKHTKDMRNAILLPHYIAYANSLNVSIKTCWQVPLFDLCKVVIAQVLGFTGSRCMELLPYKCNLRFLDNQRKEFNDPFLIPNDNFRIKRKGFQGVLGTDVTFKNGVKYSNGNIDHSLQHFIFKIYSYKNKKAKIDSKDIILGYTNFPTCDPAQFLFVYRKRLEALPHIQKLFAINSCHYTNNFFFCWPDGSPVTVENAKDIFVDLKAAAKMPKDFKITTYSARIGLPTMMLARGLSETMVYDYGAWARPSSSAAMMGYCRMSLEDRILLPRLVCLKKTLYDDIIFSPADFHR